MLSKIMPNMCITPTGQLKSNAHQTEFGDSRLLEKFMNKKSTYCPCLVEDSRIQLLGVYRNQATLSMFDIEGLVEATYKCDLVLGQRDTS